MSPSVPSRQDDGPDEGGEQEDRDHLEGDEVLAEDRVGDRLGRIAPGYLANVVVIDGDDLFAKKAKIRDVWIAGRVNVIAGVTIGRGAVIGAGAVVTRDIPKIAIAEGIPAKAVKSRRDEANP